MLQQILTQQTKPNQGKLLILKFYKMKNLIYGVSFLALVGVAIISCQKESINPRHNQSMIKNDDDNLQSKVGYYHNEILKVYYTKQHQLPLKEFTEDNIQSKVIEVLTIIDKEKFQKDEILSNINELNRVKKQIGISLLPSNQGLKTTTDNFSIIIDYISVSNELKTKLTLINEAVKNRENSEKILSLVNDLESQTWTINDQAYVDVFVQVYNHSYSYWNNNNSGNKADGDTVILADAAGALYGLLCGPFAAVCSIVEGALFSIIANN
ncbi:MAG: hypothetical protein RQ875_12010 [Vicingaceae bacterium]|nr:hypothetical protein [Vicingaceae bacterium]